MPIKVFGVGAGERSRNTPEPAERKGPFPSRTSRMIPSESALERDFAVVLEFSPHVVD